MMLLRTMFNYWPIAKLLTAISLALCLVACSATPPPKPPLAVVEGENLPFSLRIIDEANDGGQLHVLAGVTAHMPWNAEKMVVRLSGMNAGHVVTYTDMPLNRALKPVQTKIIERGEELSFALSVPLAGVSDYQLEILWGADAAGVLDLSDLVQVRNVSLAQTDKRCTEPQCKANPLITAEIYNGSERVLANILLALNFVREAEGRPLDLSAAIPKNEQSVALIGVVLQPKQTRALRLVIDKGLPEDMAGSWHARLRVIKAEAK